MSEATQSFLNVSEIKTPTFWEQNKNAVWAVFLVFLGIVGGKINDLPGFKNTIDSTRADLVRLEQDVKVLKGILDQSKLLEKK